MITLGELKKVIKIIDQRNLSDNYEFDYLRIIKTESEENYKTPLFFPLTITEEELSEGWYYDAFDKRKELNDTFIRKMPNCTFVVEPWMLSKITDKKAKIIVVDNIMNSVKKIFSFSLKKSKSKVILVTGSIGKTSMVGLIEHLIKDRVYRIYSKRITPLVLYHHFINNINNNYKYVVLEAAMFYKNQVEYFSRTLNPFISIIMNIKKEHLGINGIDSVDDIIKEKMKISLNANNIILNNTDFRIRRIKIKNGFMYYKGEKTVNVNSSKIIRINKLLIKPKPYIKTKLSILQNTIALKIAEILGIDKKTALSRISNYVPVEKRVNKEKLYNKEIIFDGDVSGVIRLETLSEHYYPKSILIIRYLTKDGEEVEDYTQLKKLYRGFNEIYIHQDLANSGVIKLKKNVKIFSDQEFIKTLPDDYQIFYHFGSYYRKYKKFDPNILEKGESK